MKRAPMTRASRKPRSLAAFWRDRRGVSAVEFALIAPLLILMYFGMAELSQAMMAQRRVSNITSAIGDLVAQNNQAGPTKMNDIFRIGRIIMAPFPTAQLSMCVASVSSNDKGKDTVDWSKPSGTGVNCPAEGTEITVDVGVLPANQSVILARVSYAYTSPVKFVLSKPLTLTRTYYLRPRKSDVVIWNKDI